MFVITVSEADNIVRKHYFETSQVIMLQWLAECYTGILSGKSMKDMNDIINNYDKRFGSIMGKRKVSTQ
jgi:hypothetical protein